MIMLVEISRLSADLGVLRETLEKMGAENNLQIHVMHEDVFNTMHHV